MRCLVFILLTLPSIAVARLSENTYLGMMTKLCKKTEGKIYYWEIWEDVATNKLVIHAGLLRHTGEVSELIEWNKRATR